MIPFRAPTFISSDVPASNPAIRGSKMTHVSNSNTSGPITFPAGTQAGDMCILFAGHGWIVNLPSGYTSHNNLTGTNTNGRTMYKTLTAADISTGSVTVTFSNTYYGAVWMVVMQGAYTVVTSAGTDFVRHSTGSTTRNQTSTSSANINDTALYFMQCRLSSRIASCNRGTFRDSSSAGNDTNAGYAETIASAGTISLTWTITATPTSDYYGILILR
jgi:hypothetical protein